jgi:hypothetical protein
MGAATHHDEGRRPWQSRSRKSAEYILHHIIVSQPTNKTIVRPSSHLSWVAPGSAEPASRPGLPSVIHSVAHTIQSAICIQVKHVAYLSIRLHGDSEERRGQCGAQDGLRGSEPRFSTQPHCLGLHALCAVGAARIGDLQVQSEQVQRQPAVEAMGAVSIRVKRLPCQMTTYAWSPCFWKTCSDAVSSSGAITSPLAKLRANKAESAGISCIKFRQSRPLRNDSNSA